MQLPPTGIELNSEFCFRSGVSPVFSVACHVVGTRGMIAPLGEEAGLLMAGREGLLREERGRAEHDEESLMFNPLIEHAMYFFAVCVYAVALDAKSVWIQARDASQRWGLARGDLAKNGLNQSEWRQRTLKSTAAFSSPAPSLWAES